MSDIRPLRPEEIQCRAQSVKANGWVVLLYKDARCDMDILDETYGSLNWKREHSRDNANCTVSIFNDKINQWVSKEDTGTESNTEQAKGLASDSFKRACFNWGIGRELYSAPFIWINARNGEIKMSEYNGKKKYSLDFKVKLRVESISTLDGKIKDLVIVDQNGDERFSLKAPQSKPSLTPDNPKWEDAVHSLASTKTKIATIKKHYNVLPKHEEMLIAESLEFSNA